MAASKTPRLTKAQVGALIEAYESSKAAGLAQENAKNIAVLNGKVDNLIGMVNKHMNDEDIDSVALHRRVDLIEAQLNKYKGALGILVAVASILAAGITSAIAYFKH